MALQTNLKSTLFLDMVEAMKRPLEFPRFELPPFSIRKIMNGSPYGSPDMATMRDDIERANAGYQPNPVIMVTVTRNRVFMGLDLSA